MTKADFKRRIQIITAIAIVVVLAAVFILIGQFVSIISVNNKKDALAQELNRAEQERILFEQELEYRESAKYAEQYAREVLGYGYEDEERFTIKD